MINYRNDIHKTNDIVCFQLPVRETTSQQSMALYLRWLKQTVMWNEIEITKILQNPMFSACEGFAVTRSMHIMKDVNI